MGKKAKELWNNDFTCVFSKYRLEDLVKLGCARLFIVACLFIVMQKAEEVLKADSALILKCAAED